jgi:hypothetical protein
MTLLELAERCEKATGPDARWSFAICARPSEPIAPSSRQPDYTASLDAAMTLVAGRMVPVCIDARPEGALR